MKFSLVGVLLLALFSEAVASYSAPQVQPDARLVMYVQTFKQPDGKPLSLLPLLLHRTRVTHVILASVHLHEEPGQIRLNDDPFESSSWDTIWREVKILQENGVKVMALLGGAAAGTYKRLNGTDAEVSQFYTSSIKHINSFFVTK